MRGKFLVELPSGIKAVVVLAVEIPQDKLSAASILGISEQEIKNLEGDEFQRIVDAAGLDDGGGV